MRFGINHADVSKTTLRFYFVKAKWTVFYNVEKDGSQSILNAVAGGYTEGKVTVNGGGKTKSAAYTVEEKNGLIYGNPQQCKMVTIEGEETEVVEALKQVLGGGVINGPTLQTLTANLKEVA